MISAKRIAASRRNGQKSRGPKTPAGKKHASKNARTHGLSSLAPADSGLVAEIARAICEGDEDSLVYEQAIEIAESQIWLNAIIVQKLFAIERLSDPTRTAFARGDTSLKMAKREDELTNVAFIEHAQLIARCKAEGKPLIHFWESTKPVKGQPPVKYQPLVERNADEAISEALADLVKLERYEKRAYARRNRAVRRLIAIRATKLGRVHINSVL